MDADKKVGEQLGVGVGGTTTTTTTRTNKKREEKEEDTYMTSGAVHHGLLPDVSAELTGHFVPACRDIFMSASISVDFGFMHWMSNRTGTTTDMHDATENRSDPLLLLLTVSVLHEIREVRVLLEKSEGNGEDGMRTWSRVRLDSSTFRAVDRRMIRVGEREPPLSHVTGPENQEILAGNQEEIRDKEHEAGRGDENDDSEAAEGDVLELVFGSSDDEKDGDSGIDAAEGAVVNQHMPPEGDDSMYTQFMLTLSPFATDEMEAVERGALRIVRCCIEVALLPSEQLAKMSIPRITMASWMGSRDISGMFVPSEDDYVLLAGQRFCDYLLCPRVACAEGAADAAWFKSVDVHVTAVSALLCHDAPAQWEVASLKALPVLPEDLLCVFLRAHGGDHMLPSVEEEEEEEIHANMRWSVRHHPAYTLLSANGHKGMCDDGTFSFYFFHCDHALSDCLFPLIHAVHSAWRAIAPSALRMASTVPFHDGDTTWVVTGCSNALLNLRRGVLCMRGAVILDAEVLRTMRAPIASPAIFYADALRAKAAVLTAALELKWRAAAACSNDVPEYSATPSNVAITRAWALCLLCNEPGWTELLRQERQIASCSFLTADRIDPWWLPCRYVWEAQDTLLFLSSTFAVTSIQEGQYYPWQLLQEEQETHGKKVWLGHLGAASVLASSGIQFSLVRRLLLLWLPRLRHRRLQQAQQRDEEGEVGRRGGNFTSPCVLFVGSFCYEEKLRRAGRRDVRLQLKFPETDFLRHLRKSSGRAAKTMWDFDVPFTLLYFTVEGSESFPLAVAASRGEEALPQCHISHVMPCCWRVSGYDCLMGRGQNTSFSVLMASQGSSSSSGDETELKGGEKGRDGDGDNGNDGSKKRSFVIQIPLLVLLSRTIPAALLLHVQHVHFWSSLSSHLDVLARRAVLRHVMEQAVQEGKDRVEEAQLLFTPLINQLLEGLLDECRRPTSEEEPPPLESIFLPALKSTSSNNKNKSFDAAGFWHRIHPNTYARFMRVGQRISPNLLSTPFLVKRGREDGIKDQVGMFLAGAAARLGHHFQTLTAHHASLPQPQPQKRRRLVLGLRRMSTVTQTMEEKRAGGVPSPTPVEVAAMISRVLSCGAASSESGGIAARRAALSLVLPLWLLLQHQLQQDEQSGHCAPPDGENRETLDAAQKIYKSICDGDAAARGVRTDAVLLKAYECFMQDAQSRS